MQQLNCIFALDRVDKSYYDSLTNGWSNDGQVLGRRNPPANTVVDKVVDVAKFLKISFSCFTLSYKLVYFFMELISPIVVSACTVDGYRWRI
jgi:hypothetical protein